MDIQYHIDLNVNDFGQRADALFHLGESYPLAHGNINGGEWECRLANCGEQRLYNKKGDRIANDELWTLYDTDEKLWKAIDSDEITIGNNSWWQLEFFVVDDSSSWYLDYFNDNSEVVDSPTEALTYFVDLMNSKDFVHDFKDEMNKQLKERRKALCK